MSLGFPARTAVVCAIVCASGAVRAQEVEKEPVAIVSLSDDPGAKKLRDDLYSELSRHWKLMTTGTRDFDAALIGPFNDEDKGYLDDATKDRASAQADIDNVTYDQAAAVAEAGLKNLIVVTPAKAAPVAADIAFLYGSAQLYLRHPAVAARWFQFVHRLDPDRALDPVHIDPDTISAYKKAIAGKVGKTKVEVFGTGELWIDGRAAGTAPATVELEEGLHLVQLAGPAREVRGQLEEVGKEIKVADAPASPELLVARARVALRNTPDDAVARAPAMKHLAELLGVHDAVLIWKSTGGKLLVQTWRDRAPGFSAMHEYIEDDKPIDLLTPLAPAKPPVLEVHDTFRAPLPPFNPPTTEPEPPWYRKTWVQATVAGGVIAAVVGGILWARHSRNVTYDRSPGWEGMTP